MVCLQTKESAALKCEISATALQRNLRDLLPSAYIHVSIHVKFQQEVINTHARKTARLLYRETNTQEHIDNIFSYELSFSQKLILCRCLKFALPQKVSPIDVMASFQKEY